MFGNSKGFWVGAFMTVSTVAYAGGSPVDFTLGGPKADHSATTFKVKINAEKPVKQVDIHVKYKNAAGAVVEESTYIWKNIVKSVPQPIEKGKTYDGYIAFDEGQTSIEAKLERVVYGDGSDWRAPK